MRSRKEGEEWRAEKSVIKKKLMTKLEEKRKQMVCRDFSVEVWKVLPSQAKSPSEGNVSPR